MSNQPRGYMALISTLIMSAMLTLYLFTVSGGAFSTRFRELAREHKYESRASAYSCISSALQYLQVEPAYAPHHLSVYLTSSTSCTIDSLTQTPGDQDSPTFFLATHASDDGVRTVLRAHISRSAVGAFEIDSVQETTSIPP